MKKRLAGYTVLLSVAIAIPLAWGQGPQKRVAIFPFTTSAGIRQFWEGNFNPGEAMTAIVTNLLTKSSRYAVLDRANMDKMMQEQNMSTGGQVTPETAVKVGQMMGAQYGLFGAITQFAATKKSGFDTSTIRIPGLPVGGGGGSQRITVEVEAHFTNFATSQMTGGMTGKGEDVVSSFNFGGVIPGADIGVGVQSSEFVNSGLGKAMYKAANDLAAQMEQVQFTEAPPTPEIKGVVIDADSSGYTLNVGSKDGVVKGMKFTVVRDKKIIDPTTNQPRIIHQEVGTMTVTAVDTDTCTCKAGPSTPPFKVKDTAKLER